MRAIDIHAHLTPQCFQRVVLAGKEWHGMTRAEGRIWSGCWVFNTVHRTSSASCTLPAKLGTAYRNWPRQYGGATSRAQHRGAALAAP